MNNFIPEFMEVLTQSGWLELTQYKKRQPLLVLNKEFKPFYIVPKIISNYNYKGPLLEIHTDSCQLFLKPNSQVLINGKSKKAKDINKQDLFSRFHLGHKVDSVSIGEWSGKLHSFFFGEELYLPIRFENDYLLMVV